ncbi:unnamed protein product, partial [Laminaria digitata]
VCRFICAYDTPPKIILQVYVQLLRCIQPEVKELVHAALDILVPALPFRLTTTEFMKAIKWTKKIMYEEGHALPQLIHMWHIIVRHPVLFYSCRSHFVGQMVNSLSRLGLAPNCPRESRQLAVSLADLMIKWEAHGLERIRVRRAVAAAEAAAAAATATATALTVPDPGEVAKGTKRPLESGQAVGGMMTAGAGMTGGGSGGGGGGVGGGQQQVETVVNFVVRVALFAMTNLKDNNLSHLSRQCLGLLEKALSLWPDTPIKYTYFDKEVHAMIDIDPQATPQTQLQATMKALPGVLETSLDILIISLGAEETPATAEQPAASARSPNNFVLQNVAKFQRLLGPSLRADTAGIRQRLLRLIQRLAVLYGPGRPPREFQEAKFWDSFQGSVERRLKAALSDKSPPLTAAVYASAAGSLPPTAVAASNAAANAGGGGSSVGGGGGGDADRSKALSSIKIVESVSSVFPEFADVHAASLMELVRVLSRQHFQAVIVAASLAARCGGIPAGTTLPPGLAGSDPMSPGARVLPTPNMAVLNAAVSVEVVLDDPPLTEHLEALVISLKLLRGITSRGAIANVKKVFQSLSAACLELLEKSDNVVLLTTVMGFVKDWLLCEPVLPASPSLSDQERTMFVQRLVRLDKLSEPRVQSVVKLQLEVIDALVNFPEGTSRPKWVQAEAPRLFMAGLMATDPDLRRRVRFSNRLVDEAAAAAAVAAMTTATATARAAAAAGAPAGAAAVAAAAAARAAAVAPGSETRGAASPSSVILHAMRLDWEPLQLRFWPAAVAEVLLGLVDGEKALALAEDKCLRPFSAAGGGGGGGGGATGGVNEVIDPLRGLLHADVTLADEVWTRTLTVAWSTFSDRRRAEFSGVAGALLAKPWHTKALNLPPLMQGSHSVNVIQSLLRGILALRPLPPLPVDLLGALAVGFNAWHTVIPAFEHQV